MYAELDSRKRLSLGKVATAPAYVVTPRPGGAILLEPAVVMTEGQAAMLADPDFQASIARARAENGPGVKWEGRRRPRREGLTD
ncbi:hypothetical protein [Demequina sp.]|uniref:hypothetical protein n=1 Tax=Demequina sp. TaxID=2050685 RepID=UPI003D0D49C7